MTSRVSQVVLLCEDEEQEKFANAYLKRCGFNRREIVRKVAALERHGGNIGWVLDEFPRQLRACRQRNAVKAKTLLVVLVDADDQQVEQRKKALSDPLLALGHEPFRSDKPEPAVLLIARRHVETWIRALLGESVTEEEDCKGNRPFDKVEIRQAVQRLHDWSHGQEAVGETCVPSLKASLSDWRRIG